MIMIGVLVANFARPFKLYRVISVGWVGDTHRQKSSSVY